MEFEFIAGLNRPAATVEAQPSTVLTCWLVVRVANAADVLVGVRPDVMTWRRSTPIVEFRPKERLAITASRRHYVLQGPPADTVDDAQLIRDMLEGNGIHDATEVTAPYWAAMLAATPSVGLSADGP